MNATQSGTLREYLIGFNPEVWEQVVRNDLQGAALWDWPKEKVQHLRFRGFHQSPTFNDGGFLYLPNADLYVKEYGNMPWAGLPPERQRREVRPSGETKVSARPKYREEVELAYGLNQAMARWRGRAYMPGSRDERVLHGSVLVEQAAQTGDVKRMQEIFETYDWDDVTLRAFPWTCCQIESWWEPRGLRAGSWV